MAIKYDLKANPFVREGDKQVLYPDVVVSGTMTTDNMVAEISQFSSFSPGCVEGVLVEVVHYVERQLRAGYNVRIDELGTFSLSLSSRPVTDKSEIRAASIGIGKVNFRATPALVKRVRRGAQLLRAESGFRESSGKYTKEQRLALLKEYLEKEGSITLKTYTEWSGLARTTASRELKAWETTGILATNGRHSQLVYVLR